MVYTKLSLNHALQAGKGIMRYFLPAQHDRQTTELDSIYEDQMSNFMPIVAGSRPSTPQHSGGSRPGTPSQPSIPILNLKASQARNSEFLKLTNGDSPEQPGNGAAATQLSRTGQTSC